MKYQIITLVLLSLIFNNVEAQYKKRILPLDKSSWEFPNDSKVQSTIHKGKYALYLNREGYLKDFEFKNGTLEVKIAANIKRSFAGFIFRANHDHAEKVYLRMHKSRMPDAIQYSPIFNEESNWQLYRELQNTTVFNTDDWNTLKLAVYNNQAVIFVNDVELLKIDKLRTDNTKGRIGFFGLFGNWFADLTYSPEVDEKLFPIISSPKKNNIGIIKNWQVSEVYSIDELKNNSTLNITKKARFDSFKTEESGLLPISKYRKKLSQGKFEKNKIDFVIAKLIIHSDKKQTKKIYFDYSDKLTFYLNETMIFEGNNTFRAKGIQHTGHLGINSNALFLNLNKGKNEIICMISEKANGWGLMARFEDLKHITIE